MNWIIPIIQGLFVGAVGALIWLRVNGLKKRIGWLENDARGKMTKSFQELAEAMGGHAYKLPENETAAFRAGVDSVSGARAVDAMNATAYDTPYSPGFSTRSMYILGTKIADETARSEIEALAKEIHPYSGQGNRAYFIDSLEDPTGNEGDDKAALQRIHNAVQYFEVRGEGLPFDMTRLGNIVWFVDPETVPAPKAEESMVGAAEQQQMLRRDFAAQRVPDDIEREAVAWMYSNGHRWTGREWLPPATNPVDALVAASQVEAVKLAHRKGYAWNGTGWDFKETVDVTAWECKIGIHGKDWQLMNGADSPMRAAVMKAFREVVGMPHDFCFSGWSAQLDPIEADVAFPKPL